MLETQQGRTDRTEENRIRPGKQVELPLGKSPFEPSGIANVYWWFAAPQKPGWDVPVADRVRMLVVKIR